MSKNIKIAMDNFSRMQSWNTTMTVDDVNDWLDDVNDWIENHSDLIFCNGRGRRVFFEKITDKMYKVYTKEI